METKVIVQNNGSAEWNLDGTFRSTEIPVLIINPIGGKSAAVQLVKDNVPEVVDSLPLSYIRFDDYDSDGNINMVAVYEKNGDKNSDDESDPESTISITGGGGTSHITEALVEQTLLFNDSNKRHRPPETAIGWNGKSGAESEVSGVDIVSANCRLVITKDMSVSKLTTSYIRKLLKMIGTVNSGKFKGWDRGEVLFEDFSYSAPDSGQKRVTVTFNFAIQMNEENFYYAGHTISKLGWEYVWGMTEELNNEKFGLKTVRAYKAQVYPFADFSAIGV